MKRFITTTLMASILLSGCMSTPDKKVEGLTPFEEEQLKTKKETMELLAKSALLASKAQSVLAKTEQAYYQPLLNADKIRQARFQNEYIPRGMEKEIEISWASSPEPVLHRLSVASGYELVFKNQRPPIPEDVYISSEPKSIKTLLDIVEQQTTGYIESIVTTDTYDAKIILVTYAKF